MIYLEYVYYKQRYKDAMELVDSILGEKEELFARTQPNAIRYDKDKVIANHDSNVLEDYVIAKEQRRIVERLSEAKLILQERKDLMKLKEQELRESKEIIDIVYVLRYLDRMRIKKIRQAIHYSDAQIYRILDEIKNELTERDKYVRHSKSSNGK